jgi:ferric-dicitrate binding protein FerR (iron transport regulator)
VYFEVAHNAEKPFLVKSGSQIVEVLGTHFNINAYPDENRIKTTLLEGSVAISSAGHRQKLKPGQQAVLSGQSLKISEADTDEAMAWKEGYFQFADADIKTVMRQISRWYDVDVVFEGPVTKQTFTGRVSRFRNISNVLKIVQSYGDVNLVFEGRRIMVR